MQKNINDFIASLTEIYTGIQEIWWLGSRASNSNVRPDSDWDILVVADCRTFALLQQDHSIRDRALRLNIDLMVELDNGFFRSPWENKILVKDALFWHRHSEELALYWAFMTRKRTAEEFSSLSDWEQYAMDQGANPQLDISDWRIAKKIWTSPRTCQN